MDLNLEAIQHFITTARRGRQPVASVESRAAAELADAIQRLVEAEPRFDAKTILGARELLKLATTPQWPNQRQQQMAHSLVAQAAKS